MLSVRLMQLRLWMDNGGIRSLYRRTVLSVSAMVQQRARGVGPEGWGSWPPENM